MAKKIYDSGDEAEDSGAAKAKLKKPSFFNGESYKGFKVSLRLVREGLEEHTPVRVERPEDVYKFMKTLGESDRERFYSLCLDSKSAVVNCEEISTGSVEKVLVHPREVFKSAILSSSHALILVHNHPSGSPEPSLEDAELTRQLYEAGELLGIELVDSVVIGHDSYYSFQESGVMRMYKKRARG